MIYQLIKFNSSRWIWVLALVAAAVCGVAYRYAPLGTAFALPIVMISFASAALWGSHQPRYTLFEASLPIRARDLFAAKVLHAWAWIWFLFLACIAVTRWLSIGTTLQSQNTASAIVTGSILTLALITQYSIHTPSIRAPQSSKWALGVPAAISLLLLDVLTYTSSHPVRYALSAFAVCGLASAVLFARIWLSIPAALEIAPALSRGYELSETTRRLPSTVWMPVLRTLFNAPLILWLGVLVMTSFEGESKFEFCWGFSVFAFSTMRLRTHGAWMFALPISRHGIFAILMLPSLAVIGLGSLSHFAYPSRPTFVAILDFAAVSALLLLIAFFVQLLTTLAARLSVGWARLLPYLTPISLLPVLWFGWRWFDPRTVVGTAKAARIELLFLSIPPSQVPLAFAVATVIVAVLYFLADAAFGWTEISPKRIMPTQ